LQKISAGNAGSGVGVFVFGTDVGVSVGLAVAVAAGVMVGDAVAVAVGMGVSANVAVGSGVGVTVIWAISVTTICVAAIGSTFGFTSAQAVNSKKNSASNNSLFISHPNKNQRENGRYEG
jgi:hypothetical protein